MIFPALWSLAGSRAGAALISAAYFLGASRGLPEGVSIFFGSDLLLGLLLWAAASLVFVSVHTACWTRLAGWQRPCRYLFANVLMSLPPLGVVGWANPTTAAGVLFPAWSWWGFALTVGLSLAATTRIRSIAIAVIGALALLSAVTWESPSLPRGWQGVDTNFVSGREQYADYDQQLSTIALVRDAVADGAEIVVLPESAFGIWTTTTEALWQRWLTDLDVTVVGGAVLHTGAGYDNLMVSMTADSAELFYRQRMPVPVSMWRPWTPGGASADFFGNAVVELDDIRVAVLLCYEQLLVWPVLHSMLLNADLIAAPGNGWWTGATSIVPNQRASVVAWARLFGAPLVLSFNR